MKFNVRKSVLYTYLLISCFIGALLMYIFLSDIKNSQCRQQDLYNLIEINDYETHYAHNSSTLFFTVKIDPKIGNILSFNSVHQAVEIFENENLIYKYPTADNNPFGKSPGYAWHFVELKKDINSIKIVITSPYRSHSRFNKPIYVGNVISLTSHIFDSNIFSFIICVIIFFIGFCMTIYFIIVRSKTDINNKLVVLGIFSILLSIWSINECNLSFLILRNNIVTSYISFLSLMLLPMPYAIFIKSYYNDNNKVWNYFFVADVIQIIFCVLMQVTGLLDLSSTLWSTHIMIIFIAFIVLYDSFINIHDTSKSLNVKIHIICLMICAFCLILDLISFYNGADDNNVFGRIGFLLYIIVLGISSTWESIDLMKKGRQAREYRQLAFTDQMTGMKNRTCFNNEFEEFSQKPDDIAIIDFDLNNLKHINDNYGHSSGDKYISGSARIISEIFANIGSCYRVGGDEFVVIIDNSSNIDIVYYLAMLESSIDSFNRENKGFKMQIAYGTAVYDPETDKSLEDTYNRADKFMYEDKKLKKSYSKK